MKTNRAGFTLVEMAIVLVIVGLLLGGLLMPLSTQVEQRRISETQKYLEQIKEALLGFAAANGRLPCPASAASNGVESPPGGGACTNPYDGFLPAVTLGLTPIDNQGYAIDAWNQAVNRIRYAVFVTNPPAIPLINSVANPFTTANGMRNATMAQISAYATSIIPFTPLLSVCSSASAATNCGGAANTLTTQTPVVIYSVGQNAASGGAGADEAANPNPNGGSNDTIFVSHPPTPTTAANGEFDDIVTWISVNTLFSRMIAAGTLP